ncbi:MAG: 6-carboxytetrahydropterin synthase [Candidatus Caldarchaeum sp.]|uniref:6-carboxytetrahydropterin synthase n=1 Tax=Caldiarchaeum subterraneum TaxID=311458 RepID=A0A7C5LBR8_CALS0
MVENIAVRRLKAIEVGGPSLNFDYAHFLPSSPKCGVLHGHTSMVNVKVVGQKIGDMVLEFGELKKIVKRVIDEMDHKLIVASRYIVEDRNGAVRIVFDGIGGRYELMLPRTSVYVIDQDSTVENISEHIAERVKKLLPSNITKITVRMTEGLGKSATSST